MVNELKPMNLVHLTGRITVKRYSEQSKSLFIVLGVFTPKSALTAGSRDSEWNRDYPAIVFTGEMAQEINEKYEIGDRLSVIGHMDTRQRMSYEGNRMYKEVWESYIVPDIINPAAGRIDANSVIFSGEIIRVYRNPDEGKKFYLITVKMPDETGKMMRATFTHFDPKMELEPQVGEKVYAGGVLQTKRENVSGEGRNQTRFIMSVVSRNLIMQREKQAAPAPEKPAEEDDDIAI